MSISPMQPVWRSPPACTASTSPGCTVSKTAHSAVAFSTCSSAMPSATPASTSSRFGRNWSVTTGPTTLAPGWRATAPPMNVWRTPMRCMTALAVALLTSVSRLTMSGSGLWNSGPLMGRFFEIGGIGKRRSRKPTTAAGFAEWPARPPLLLSVASGWLDCAMLRLARTASHEYTYFEKGRAVCPRGLFSGPDLAEDGVVFGLELVDDLLVGHRGIALGAVHHVPDRVDPICVGNVEGILDAEVRLLKIVENQIVASVKLFGRHVDAHRARTLVEGELGVDLGIDDGGGEVFLCLQHVRRNAAEDAEGVDGDRHGLGAGDVDAAEVLAFFLARTLPHALHPVAVDLHECLAGDHGIGRVVPGAVDPAGVGLLGDLAEELDGAQHGRIVKNGLVGLAVLDHVEAFIDVRAGVGGEKCVERVARLEGIAADGDERLAGLLDLGLIGPHVVEGGPFGRIDAGLCRHCLAVVDHAVDVHGGRDLADLAVDGDRLQHGLGERLGRADLVEQRADFLTETLVAQVAEGAGIGGDEQVRRGAGDDKAGQRAFAGGFVRHGS